MEWSKLKNLILLILAVTNLFLLVLVGSRAWNAARYQSNARSDAIQVLARSGIAVNKDILPKDRILSVGSVSRDREGEAGILTPLLGEVTVEPLGGGRFMYTGENGVAQLSSRGEFSLTLHATTPPTTSLSTHAEETLAKIGIQARAITLQPADPPQVTTVTLIQQWQGIPVLSCTTEASFGDGILLNLSGTRLSGVPHTVGSVEMSVVTGLLRFLEQLSATGGVCSAITAMTPAYQLTSGLSDPATLSPVWYIETDSGAYTLDVATAALRRL